MTRVRGRRSLYVAVTIALSAQPWVASAQTAPAPANAADAKKACILQHEAAQSLRRTGKILEAREATVVCSRDECPAAVRSDCVDWLEGMSKNVPSLVFRLQSDGRDVSDVRVSLDGKLLTSRLDGTPLELNPGPHTLRFEYGTFDPIQQEILVLEGEKNRVVAANFVKAAPVAKEPPPKPVEPAAPVETYRPTPVLTYVLGGVALAGVASFTAFGLSGQSEKKSLEKSCRPTCSDSELEPVQTRFLIGDLSLGIAVASAVTAGILYVTRPSRPLPPVASRGNVAWSPSRYAVGIAPTPSGAQFAMGAEF